MEDVDKTSRREFLGYSAAALPALAFPSGGLWAAGAHIPLGIQLFTVRDQLEKDLPGTLKKIRAAGHEQVETYGDSSSILNFAISCLFSIGCYAISWYNISSN
jgi:hypothetical protein